MSSSCWAGERVLTFRMIDLYPSSDQRGAEHLVGIALGDGGRLVQKDHAIRKLPNGQYAGTCTYTFEDGSTVSSEFTLVQDGLDYSADYKVVSGTGALAGAHGVGHLTTMKGYEGASSSTGVYQVQFRVDVPNS
ncbi:hypothetical protein SLNSH_16515 [Alsobacter soli]|uniref:DUF3224 domain-containing protein n=1 Tax=Alsobacter soli TaxID=2109933 RepID=A0A2T1HQE3_9HYPH|nr:hypothetical protein SLNSH_16515 [Alsobacter soli]